MGSESHPSNVFEKPKAYSIYLHNQSKLYKENVIMNLSLEKVFRLRT